MKRVFLWMSVAGILFATSSCEKIIGEGPVVTETRNTAGFDAIAVSIPADVYFSESTLQNISLEAQQNILDEIETIVIENKLRIRFKDPDTRIRTAERIVVRIAAPDVRNFEMSGSGNLEIIGAIDPPAARFFISGSGNIRADELTTNKIEAVISGSGDIEIREGEANEEKISISGSGSVDMADVIVKDADTHISGSGSMKVYPTHTLKARISGSGTVFYRGDPAISSQISGSGSVVRF